MSKKKQRTNLVQDVNQPIENEVNMDNQEQLNTDVAMLGKDMVGTSAEATEQTTNNSFKTTEQETIVETLQEKEKITPKVNPVKQPKTVEEHLEKVYSLNNQYVNQAFEELTDYIATMSGPNQIQDKTGAQKQLNMLASFKKIVIYTKEEFNYVFSVYLMLINKSLQTDKQNSAFYDSKKLRFLPSTFLDESTKLAFKFMMNFLSDSCDVKNKATVKFKINFNQLKPLFSKNNTDEKAEEYKNKLNNFFIEG